MNVLLISDHVLILPSSSRQYTPNRQWEARPTVLFSREEYANLFHTVRELMNTWQALIVSGVIISGTRPSDVRKSIRVIWMDGHAKASSMCYCRTTLR